jgi:hypothetical protein
VPLQAPREPLASRHGSPAVSGVRRQLAAPLRISQPNTARQVRSGGSAQTWLEPDTKGAHVVAPLQPSAPLQGLPSSQALPAVFGRIVQLLFKHLPAEHWLAGVGHWVSLEQATQRRKLGSQNGVSVGQGCVTIASPVALQTLSALAPEQS